MKRSPFLVKKNIYQWEGALFNLICALYFFFLAPIVLEASANSFFKEGPAFIPWLGVVLIIISLLEIYAFPKKMKYVHKAVQDEGKQINSGFTLWMFHAVISIIILFMATEAFGYEIVGEDGENAMPWGLSILIPAVVIKELYLLFTIIGVDPEENLEAYDRPNKKEWKLDLILVIYACLAYTVTWQTISHNMDMEKHNLPMYILNLILSTLIFLIFYLPIRIPYFLEEMTQMDTQKEWIRFIVPLLITVIAVVAGL